MTDAIVSHPEDGQSATLNRLDRAETVVAPAALRRVNPLPGMMIDVETWRDAHEYHRAYARLHHLALHGWGIVTGLDVIVGQSVNALLVQPGVAVDRAGNFVIVDREQVHRIGVKTRGMVYLALRYRDAPAEVAGNESGPPTRVLESFAIEERTLPPTDADLELGRVDFDPQFAPVRAPADPQKPGRNELDTRWRPRLGPAAGSIGVPVPTVHVMPGQAAPSDVLERIDVLATRLQQLDDQVHAYAASDRESAPQLGDIRERVDDIARQVLELWQRVQVVATPAVESTPGDEAATPPSRSEWQIVELRERLDALARQVTDMNEHFQALTQERQELSRQSQALVQQMDSLSRLGEAQAPDLERLRERVDRLTPELERLVATVEPLQVRVQELVDQGVATTLPSWEATAPAATRELRMAVARHRSAGWDQHLQGLRLLARELGGGSYPTARLLEPADLTEAGTLELLYITGFAALALEDAEVQGIARVLEAGGVVLAEGCAEGPTGEAGAREFAFSFIELAQRLGRRLARVERTNRLLEARYVFGDPPAGSRPPRVLEADGMIYSDADYGCAWQGGAPAHALPRSAIRDAVEFGVNIVMYRLAGS